MIKKLFSQNKQNLQQQQKKLFSPKKSKNVAKL